MRKALAVLVLLLVAVPALAEEGRAAYPGWSKEGALTWMAYTLPGANSLITRLDLSEEQKKVLGEIAEDWSKKYQEAQRKTWAQLPRLSAEDWRDEEKRRDYYAKAEELRKAAKVDAPVELVTNILTPEQLDKILKANELHTAWVKWLVERMTAADAELEKLLGPEPEGVSAADKAAYQALESCVRGAALIYRLALTAEQKAELRKLLSELTQLRGELYALLQMSLGHEKLSTAHTAAARSVLMGQIYREATGAHRERLEKLLTNEQREKLAQAAKVVEERDKEIFDRYCAHVKKVDEILPPKQKAGAYGYPYYYPQHVEARPRQ